ncbi:hypothetical protein LJB42_003954 [Komagataella kurtzmanii]|nr:hypothetical protein LJB42_003954 [Komagataella kurtzmanii]
MTKVFSAKVKNILSGDTLVLTPPNNASGSERVLSLAHIHAPRNGEPYAFESKELLRTLLIGKVIKFWITYTTSTGKEFGDISAPIFPSLVEYVLEKGGAKLNDKFDDEEYDHLREIEEKSAAEKVGLHADDVPSISVLSSIPNDSIGETYDSIIERVISGDRLIARIILNDKEHTVSPILIAGARAPRTASSDQPAEPFGEESKIFVETRLLGKSLKVTPLSNSSSGIPVCKVIHPAGNISDRLLESGLAEVSDWQSTLVGSQGMSHFRELERNAKTSGQGIWKQSSDSVVTAPRSTSNSLKIGSVFNATISRIISADTLQLTLQDNSELTVQLASLRGPRQMDSPTFVPVAREFVRKLAIGDHSKVKVEAIRPKSEQLEERPLVSITLSNGKNLSTLIVAAGYAKVIKHKRGDDDRSSDWDLLVEKEAEAISKKLGFHGKTPDAERIVDASEKQTKAKTFFNSLQNRSRISGVVEHVSGVNRFKILLPREGLKLTLVLGGLSNSSVPRDSPLYKEASSYVSQRATQRDVHFDVYGMDRTGAFIGNLYLSNESVPLQLDLLEHGFTEVHGGSLAQTKFERQFLEAEKLAQEQKVGVWENYEAEAQLEEVIAPVEKLTIDKKYLDVIITDISDNGTVSYQILDSNQAKLPAFMEQFHAYFRTNNPSLSRPPKVGDCVAAKFSENNKYYRAIVTSVDKTNHTYEVKHIDYGNTDVLTSSSFLLALPSQFDAKTLPPQAHSAQLSLLKLPPSQPKDYLSKALDYFADLTAGKNLVACVNFSNPTSDIESDITFYDGEKIKQDIVYPINNELVRNGLAIVKKQLTPKEKLLSTELETLQKLEADAKRNHLGCWEFGDIIEEDL